MLNNIFEDDIKHSLEVLRSGGIILYPTDTVWGIGCDATNESAVNRIHELKKRPVHKGMIVLLAQERELLQFVAAPDMEVFQYLDTVTKPTTVIYQGAIGLAENLLADDGSIGIRIVKDEFCRHLVKRLGKPLVSTSANLSGAPSPVLFTDVSPDIIRGVDYVVKYRQDDPEPRTASAIVSWNHGQASVIRS